MESLLPPDRWQMLKSFGWTSLFCFAIGVLLWALDDRGDFLVYLGVSCAIGWSIHGARTLLADWLERWMHPYLASIPITAVGLGIGLALGGLIAERDAAVFFTRDYGTLVISVFFGIVGLAMFSTRARLMQVRAELMTAQLTQEQQQKLLVEAELRVLQAQIEPHFLFNTLSNVAGLIKRDPDTAQQMLLNLTTWLRGSLDRTRGQNSTLEQELETVKSYLEIQMIRMQGRLDYGVQVEEALHTQPLPPLLVQPLVENAVKHGIEPCEQGGRIDICAYRKDGFAVIDVVDTGCGMLSSGRTQHADGHGIGLRNVRERVLALYGQQAQLVLLQNQPSGVIARLRLPQSQP